jgi:hypothetical protein
MHEGAAAPSFFIRRRRRVRRRGEKFWSGACPAEEFFIPIKFSGRALLSAQENLQSEENDFSFSSGASTLSMA